MPGPTLSKHRRFRRGPRPLQHPVFRRLWGVSVAGNFVRFVDFTLAAWLVVQQSDSSLAVGLLVFFRVIPFLILGPVVGTLIDRFPRIRVLRMTQIGMAGAAFGFGVALANGFSTLPVIYAYTMVMGTLLMAEIPSKRAYISDIVGPVALGSALALEMLSLNVAWFVGSNLGGVIAKLIDPSIAYIVIGAVFALNYRILRGLPAMFHPDASLANVGALRALSRSLVEGFRFARANNAIFAGLLVVGVSNFFGFAFESMAPAFAKDVYGAGPTGFGLLMSAQGLGALVAAAYMTFRGRRMRNPGLLLISAAIIQSIGSIGFSFTGTIVIGFLAIAGLGLVSLIFAVTHTVLILLASPPNIRGRIMGFQILMMGLFPLGSLAIGLTADVIGLGQSVRLFAAVGLVLLVLIWVKYPDLRKPLG